MADSRKTIELLLVAEDKATAQVRAVAEQIAKLGGPIPPALQQSLEAACRDLTKVEGCLNAVEKAQNSAAEAAKKHEGALGHLRDRLKEVGTVAAGVALGNLATGGLEGLAEGAKGFVESLIDAHAETQSFITTLSNFTVSTEAATQATEYATQFAEKYGLQIDDVRQSMLALAQGGQLTAQALMAATNIAAAHGSSVTDFVGVLERSIATGSARGLESYLRMTKSQLEAAGVLWDAHGKLIASSVIPAIEQISSTRFGDAASKQAQTLTGAMNTLSGVWNQFKETAGQAFFDKLAGSFGGITSWVEKNQGTILAWATAVGNALGTVANAAIQFANWVVQNVGPLVLPIINAIGYAWAKLQPIFETVGHAIERVMGGLGTFLQNSVLPVVENAIGQVITWWNNHVGDLNNVWDSVQTGVIKFWNWLAQGFNSTMKELQGAWTIAWGVISGVVGVAIDIISGDWKKVKSDLLGIWKAIQVGVLEILNGLIDQVIHIFALLQGPISTVLNKVFVTAFKAVVDVGVELFTYLVLTIETSFDKMVSKVGLSLSGLATKFGPILQATGHGFLAALLYGSAAVSGSAAAAQLTPAQIAAQAQAAGQSAATTAGTLIGPHPLPNITFDEGKATSAVDKFFQDAEKRIDMGLTTGATSTGKTFLERVHALWDQWMKTGPGTVPDLLKQFSGSLGDLFKPVPGGGAPGTTAADATKLLEQLLAQAEKQFDFDANVAHPSRSQLQKDEAAVLAIMQKIPGTTRLDVAYEQQTLDRRIADLFKQGRGRAGDVFAPRPQFGTLGHEVSYGEVAIAFGGTSRDPSSAIIAQLQRQNQQLELQVRRDETIIALLKSGTTSEGQQVGLLTDIRNRVGTAGPAPPSPLNAHAAVRSTGGSIPVVRG